VDKHLALSAGLAAERLSLDLPHNVNHSRRRPRCNCTPRLTCTPTTASFVVIDAEARTVFSRRLRNDLNEIVAAHRSCPGELQAVAVESTYNWYWLVDGLIDNGFSVRLVNTAAVKRYDGLKHGGDLSDARHLAELLRLGFYRSGIYVHESYVRCAT
jgi:transposase